MNRLTPMLKQYLEIKEQYPDCILFFRMGDFYEMFYEDAEKAAKAMEVALTTRDRGTPNPVPLCGIPYHAADTYLARLLNAGYKVAICEQVEDPKKAKGIVKRAVTRVITPGTALASSPGNEKARAYLAAVASGPGHAFGLAYLDFATGEFRATELGTAEELKQELLRVSPAELLCPRGLKPGDELSSVISEFGEAADQKPALAHPPERAFELEKAREILKRHFKVESLEGFGVEGFPAALIAAAAVIAYLEETQEPEENPAFEVAGEEPVSIPRPLSHITSLSYYTTSEYMVLDESTRRNLELTRTLRDGKSRGSLFWLLDRTVTPMGSRTLLNWLHYPLIDPEEINRRLDAVEFALVNHAFRLDLRDLLEHLPDLERLAARISTGSAHARDLAALREALRLLPKIKALMEDADPGLLQEIREGITTQEQLRELLERALSDDPPAALREGGLIKPGFSPEIDELEEIKRDAKAVIARLEKTEREKTGIPSLKVKFNKVFGYYLEVTKPNLHLVPETYIRKQTLVNAERFITPELKDLEAKILGAEERLCELHYEIFSRLREEAAAKAGEIAAAARELGKLDAILGLAELASVKRFCRPEVNRGERILIKGGWHPVVAELVKRERFVPNDVLLDNQDHQILIITGPNMAGKSTVLRQTALIVLLAQMGSFVPADEAEIGVVDRIFTRVGAADVLTGGMSTFMVEMTETANILHHATPKSLVLLDEIGRGTSTFDGLSIAWAVAEYLHDRPEHAAKTMFATHYHELTDLAETRPRIKNYHILVKEWEGEVIFLRKMAPGSTSRSYGIQVAALAGIPAAVVERAREILSNLEAMEHDPAGKPALSKSARQKAQAAKGPVQLSLLPALENPNEREVISRLKSLDPQNLTPLQALTLLDELKSLLKEED